MNLKFNLSDLVLGLSVLATLPSHTAAHKHTRDLSTDTDDLSARAPAADAEIFLESLNARTIDPTSASSPLLSKREPLFGLLFSGIKAAVDAGKAISDAKKAKTEQLRAQGKLPPPKPKATKPKKKKGKRSLDGLDDFEDVYSREELYEMALDARALDVFEDEASRFVRSAQGFVETYMDATERGFSPESLEDIFERVLDDLD